MSSERKNHGNFVPCGLTSLICAQFRRDDFAIFMMTRAPIYKHVTSLSYAWSISCLTLSPLSCYVRGDTHHGPGILGITTKRALAYFETCQSNLNRDSDSHLNTWSKHSFTLNGANSHLFFFTFAVQPKPFAAAAAAVGYFLRAANVINHSTKRWTMSRRPLSPSYRRNFSRFTTD